MNDGRERIIKDAERYNQTFIVAGPHWSWGSGYRTVKEAERALNRTQPSFGYHQCQCGRWIAGLYGLCANCI